MEVIVEAKNFEITVEETDYHINIEFGDGFKQYLVEDHEWDENQAESIDEEIEKFLDKKDFDCRVYWENNGLFVIEKREQIEGIDAKIVANCLTNMIKSSKIKTSA